MREGCGVQSPTDWPPPSKVMSRRLAPRQAAFSFTVSQVPGISMTLAHVTGVLLHVVESSKAIVGGSHVVVEGPHPQPHIAGGACSPAKPPTLCAKPVMHTGGGAVPA